MSLSYLVLLFSFSCVYADVYNVKVKTDQYVNVVDSKFLSFSIDPKYLFNEKLYNSKEINCMASALTPAYLRVAGPSTQQLTFTNNTIILHSNDSEPQIRASHKQWQKFMKWANATGVELVMAVNHVHTGSPGGWHSAALAALQAAHRMYPGDIFWQLGYECKNQSIEEYLHEAESLLVLAESVSSRGRVAAGDVAACLRSDAPADFRDYLALAIDIMDAVLLNGNSSAHRLMKMSEVDRAQVLKMLSNSRVPLWVTETSHEKRELERAVEWMTSLGYAARNGFSVHYRELLEEELYEPTLSFYMALLYKRLVGPLALDVSLEAPDASLFAHCAALRGTPAPRAVTLFGANMADHPRRFSLTLSRREEGGDIMQFVLGLDEDGNVVVNSEVMYYEGDIKPVLKRVGPYKTLLIKLPPKSFGFWVLANTKVAACYDLDESSSIEIVPLSEEETVKVKRSILDTARLGEESLDDSNDMLYENVAMKDIIDGINKDLRKMKTLFEDKMNKDALSRLRREVNTSKKYLNRIRKSRVGRSKDLKLSSNILDNILGITDLSQLSDIIRSKFQINKNRKRNTKKRYSKGKSVNVRTVSKKSPVANKKRVSELAADKDFDTKKTDKDVLNNIDENVEEYKDNNLRKRRSIGKSQAKNEVDSMENKIDLTSKEKIKFSKIISKIKEMGKFSVDVKTSPDYDEDEVNAIGRKDYYDDSSALDILEYANLDVFKSTILDLLKLFSDFNQNLKNVWGAVTSLE